MTVLIVAASERSATGFNGWETADHEFEACKRRVIARVETLARCGWKFAYAMDDRKADSPKFAGSFTVDGDKRRFTIHLPSGVLVEKILQDGVLWEISRAADGTKDPYAAREKLAPGRDPFLTNDTRNFLGLSVAYLGGTLADLLHRAPPKSVSRRADDAIVASFEASGAAGEPAKQYEYVFSNDAEARILEYKAISGKIGAHAVNREFASVGGVWFPTVVQAKSLGSGPGWSRTYHLSEFTLDPARVRTDELIAAAKDRSVTVENRDTGAVRLSTKKRAEADQAAAKAATEAKAILEKVVKGAEDAGAVTEAVVPGRAADWLPYLLAGGGAAVLLIVWLGTRRLS